MKQIRWHLACTCKCRSLHQSLSVSCPTAFSKWRAFLQAGNGNSILRSCNLEFICLLVQNLFALVLVDSSSILEVSVSSPSLDRSCSPSREKSGSSSIVSSFSSHHIPGQSRHPLCQLNHLKYRCYLQPAFHLQAP